MPDSPIIIGILGGIASGKSTVAGCFAQLGCAVIEADKLAHAVLEETDVKEAVLSIFGREVMDADGRINRKSLARIVFQDSVAIQRLNGLIHPRVMAEVRRLIESYRHNPQIKGIVLDVPLLAEAGGLELCDAVIFVDADRQKRLERWQKNTGYDDNELKKRENFQISLDKKRSLAHYIISNNSDASEVAGQVAQLFSSITGSR